MTIYFANRSMKILGMATTTLPKGAGILNDKYSDDIETGTTTFECDVTYDDATHADLIEWTQAGNYILRNGRNGYNFFTIIDTEDDTESMTINVYAEAAGLDLLNEVAPAYTATKKHQMIWYFIHFAEKTGWNIREEHFPLEQELLLSWDDEQTLLERLQDIAEKFGTELEFSVDIKGMKIVSKNIDVYTKRGGDNGVELMLGREVKSIVTKRNVENLVSALSCKGSTLSTDGVPTYIDADGVTHYMWMRFAAKADGSSASDYPTGKNFIGLRWYETERQKDSDVDIYDWFRIRDFKYNTAAIPRQKLGGAYTWIKYASDNKGTDMSDVPYKTEKDGTTSTLSYVGVAINKTSATKSNKASDYAWRSISSSIGVVTRETKAKVRQANGKTKTVTTKYYTWIKWADSPTSGMSNQAEDKMYIGLAFDKDQNTRKQSTDYGSYEWTRVATSSYNSNGYPQPAGNYTWIKYADDAQGKNMSDDPTDKKFWGLAYDKKTQAKSKTASDYTWRPLPQEDSDDNTLTLSGYAYDDGDIFIDGKILKSRTARAKWNRYLAEGGSGDGYIIGSYQYSTEDQKELLDNAITELKKLREPEFSYEVKLGWLPDSVALGDRVRIIDTDGEQYVSARILKEEISECDETVDVTLGEYVIEDSGIPSQLQELSDRMAALEARTMYTWIVYADDENGTGISLDSTDKEWIGVRANAPSSVPDLSDPSVYKWSRLRGDDGEDGEDGDDGDDGYSPVINAVKENGVTTITIQNKDGLKTTQVKDGTGAYIHIKYSNVPNPTDADMVENPEEYIGICTDDNPTDPTTASSYNWTKWEGRDGSQGIKGDDSYVHFAYANSPDGSDHFSTTYFENAMYMGVRSDQDVDDSTNYADYDWSRIKGADGYTPVVSVTKKDGVTTLTITNADGIRTSTIADGINSYVHIKYSKVATPTDAQMQETAAEYIGICTTNDSKDPTTASSYTWTKWQGTDGDRGIPGKDGYVHFAYSSSADGKDDFSTTYFDGAEYLGVRSDDSENDPGDYTKYTWSRIKGEDGASVVSVKPQYYLSTSSTVMSGGTISYSIPAWTPGHYYWVRYESTYSDGSTSFSDWQYDAAMTGANANALDAKSKIDGIKIGGENLLSGDWVAAYNSPDAFQYDRVNYQWEILSSTLSSPWGRGWQITTGKVRIPYGQGCIVSFEVNVPVQTSFTVDVNNYPVSGSAWGGNDNDNGSARLVSDTMANVPPNQWVKCWYYWENTSTSNTGKVDLYEASAVGVLYNGSCRFKVRHIMVQIGNTPSDWHENEADRMYNVQTRINTGLNALDKNAIMNRLTDGGKNQGIYEDNGNIYLNATMIKSGNFTAVDSQGNTRFLLDVDDATIQWNLTNSSMTSDGALYISSGHIGDLVLQDSGITYLDTDTGKRWGLQKARSLGTAVYYAGVPRDQTTIVNADAQYFFVQDSGAVVAGAGLRVRNSYFDNQGNFFYHNQALDDHIKDQIAMIAMSTSSVMRWVQPNEDLNAQDFWVPGTHVISGNSTGQTVKNTPYHDGSSRIFAFDLLGSGRNPSTQWYYGMQLLLGYVNDAGIWYRCGSTDSGTTIQANNWQRLYADNYHPKADSADQTAVVVTSNPGGGQKVYFHWYKAADGKNHLTATIGDTSSNSIDLGHV